MPAIPVHRKLSQDHQSEVRIVRPSFKTKQNNQKFQWRIRMDCSFEKCRKKNRDWRTLASPHHHAIGTMKELGSI
jgi:hypothetical protein